MSRQAEQKCSSLQKEEYSDLVRMAKMFNVLEDDSRVDDDRVEQVRVMLLYSVAAFTLVAVLAMSVVLGFEWYDGRL